MKFAGGASGEISAAIFGTGQVGVVVSNTIVGRACDLLPWARELATQGYRVMLFDYSALMPTTDIPAAVDLFAKDTVEAAAKLRELGVQKVVLISGSVGGLGALRAGLDDKPAPTVSSACRRLARTRSRNPCGGWRSLSSSWLPTTTFVPSRWRMSGTVPPPAPRAASSSYSTAHFTPISCYNPLRQRSAGRGRDSRRTGGCRRPSTGSLGAPDGPMPWRSMSVVAATSSGELLVPRPSG